MCVRQLKRRDKDLKKATFYLQHMRLKRKERHNLKHNICKKELLIRSIILLHDTRHQKNIFHKLFFKWLRLYQICNAIKDKGI